MAATVEGYDPRYSDRRDLPCARRGRGHRQVVSLGGDCLLRARQCRDLLGVRERQVCGSDWALAHEGRNAPLTWARWGLARWPDRAVPVPPQNKENLVSDSLLAYGWPELYGLLWLAVIMLRFSIVLSGMLSKTINGGRTAVFHRELARTDVNARPFNSGVNTLPKQDISCLRDEHQKANQS